MTVFESYSSKYECARMERRDGILQLTLTSDGGSLQWGKTAHRELVEVFRDIGDDYQNKVVILTGAGEEFCGPRVIAQDSSFWPDRPPSEPEYPNTAMREMIAMIEALLAIECPMIAAVNGPATRHCELALLCDIVLASETALFADSAHFPAGFVPGDGMHVIFPMLLGPNRGRYFLLMDEDMSAAEAHRLGLVGEVMPIDELLPRAWEIAQRLAKRSPSALRHTRKVITEKIRREMRDLLPYGMALTNLNLYAERY